MAGGSFCPAHSYRLEPTLSGRGQLLSRTLVPILALAHLEETVTMFQSSLVFLAQVVCQRAHVPRSPVRDTEPLPWRMVLYSLAPERDCPQPQTLSKVAES